jgi:hypothetical protein
MRYSKAKTKTLRRWHEPQQKLKQVLAALDEKEMRWLELAEFADE